VKNVIGNGFKKKENKIYLNQLKNQRRKRKEKEKKN